MDRNVQQIFGRVIHRSKIGATLFIHVSNITASAERLISSPLNDNRINCVILGPGEQLRVHQLDHVHREGVQSLRLVERDQPHPPACFEQKFRFVVHGVPTVLKYRAR